MMKATPELFSELLIVPYKDEDAFLDEAVNLDGEYPNGYRKEYKGLGDKFSRENFNLRVNGLIEGKVFLYRRAGINFAISLVEADSASSKGHAALQDVFRVLIADVYGEIDEVGYIGGADAKARLGSKLDNVLDFWCLIAKANLDGNLDDYATNFGQIDIARKLGGMNLGHTYRIGSKLGIAEKLGWTQMSVPFEIFEEFKELLGDDPENYPEKYKENSGQIQMAEDLGNFSLAQLYSLASGLGIAEDLGWTQINVSFRVIFKFKELLGDDPENYPEKYKENSGQIQMAEDLGKMNLGQLYSLASGLNVAEDLGWTQMYASFEVMGKFKELLGDDPENYPEKYKKNSGQIQMAEDLGKMNLDQLYSLARGLNVAEALGWTKMRVTFKVIEKFKELLGDDPENYPEKYKENSGQIQMAEDLGKMHLSALYSLASGLNVAEKLGWTFINAAFEKVGEFKEIVLGLRGELSLAIYQGFEGKLKFAEDFGFNESCLLTLSEHYDFDNILEWRQHAKRSESVSADGPIGTPIETVGDFEVSRDPRVVKLLKEIMNDPDHRERAIELAALLGVELDGPSENFRFEEVVLTDEDSVYMAG